MSRTPPSALDAEVGAPPGRRPATRPGAVVAALSCAGITVSVMQTLVVPLVPVLPTLLHAPASDASWAITATLLAGAAATPVLGRLGDMYGKRRMLLLSLGLLVVGSLVCALAGSLAPMVAGRALQGCAIGVIPLGISIMRDELPPERLGSAMALLSSSLGIGGALGIPTSAAIAQHTDWHVLFWSAAVLGAAASVLVLRAVPESPLHGGGRFDLVGAVGLSTGLLCLLLAVSKGGDWSWAGGTTLGLFGAAVVVLSLWGLWELRHTEPLVDLRTTARRQVLLTNLASIAIGFALYAMSLVLPQLLQLPKATGYGLGQSMFLAGLCIAPSGLMMMLVSPLSARLSAARGPKVSLLIGLVVTAVGYVLTLALIHTVWQVVAMSCVIAAGIALAYAALPALIMSAVPPSETAAANGLNALMRSIGTSSSSAVIGVVFAHMTTRFGPARVPSLGGFRAALLVAAGATVLSLPVVLAIPGRRAARPAEVPVPRAARDVEDVEVPVGHG